MTPELLLLTAAREMLDSRSEKYICDALFEAGVKHGLEDEAIALHQVIRAGITMPGNAKPEWSLTDWIDLTYGTSLGYDDFEEHPVARLARLAWLDRLVQDRL